MAWSIINGKRYYYRSRYVDGAVKTTYYGRGLEARLLEQFHTSEANRSLATKEQDVRSIDHLNQALAELGANNRWVDRLARADAILCGFKRHQRGSEWRLTTCNR